MFDTFLLDVDGTLVDTNYHHTIAWYRGFRRFGFSPPIWRIHRSIGMGGDQLVEAVAGAAFEREYGEEVRAAWQTEYGSLIREVHLFDGASELMEELHKRGATQVFASSGKAEHLDHYLAMFRGGCLADAVTTADDAEATKPEPDLVQTAMAKVGGGRAVMVGDSVWDVEAGIRAGILTIGVQTGGYSAEELRKAGAIRVYESLPALTLDLDLWTA